MMSPSFQIVVLVQDNTQDLLCANDFSLLGDVGFGSQSEKENKYEFSLADDSIFCVNVAP